MVGGNLAGDIVGEDVEIFRGLGDGDAGFQAAEGDVVAVVAVPSEAFGGVDGEGVMISLSGSWRARGA